MPHEITNAQRADWALAAITTFRKSTGTEDENLETVIQDFLCDLRHLADEHDLNFSAMNATADEHYLEEFAEVNDDDKLYAVVPICRTKGELPPRFDLAPMNHPAACNFMDACRNGFTDYRLMEWPDDVPHPKPPMIIHGYRKPQLSGVPHPKPGQPHLPASAPVAMSVSESTPPVAMSVSESTPSDAPPANPDPDPAALPDTCEHCGFHSPDPESDPVFTTCIDCTLYNGTDLQYNGGFDGGFDNGSTDPEDQPIRLMCRECCLYTPLTEAQADAILRVANLYC